MRCGATLVVGLRVLLLVGAKQQRSSTADTTSPAASTTGSPTQTSPGQATTPATRADDKARTLFASAPTTRRPPSNGTSTSVMRGRSLTEDSASEASVSEAKGVVSEWEDFKRRNNKTYYSREQLKRLARLGRTGPAIDHYSDEDRMHLFLGRKLAIDEFNKQSKTYRRGVNQFADMTVQEVVAKHTGLLLAGRKPKGNPIDFRNFARLTLPRRFDWRDRGALTEVRNQASCGCCWAFAATATLEAKNFLRGRRLVALSEQNLLDCDTINEQCNGGTPWDAYDWVQSNGGQEENENYPYEVYPDKCRQDKNRAYKLQVKGYMHVKPAQEDNIIVALYTEGPLAVAVNAALTTFIDYKEGVYSDPECSNQDDDLKHAMVLVGYGEDADGSYWILRNSWGKEWGENGHIRISRKDNLCGIMTYVVFPIVD